MADNRLNVYKGRTNVLPVSFGYDISGDVFLSEIRTEVDRTSSLVATWISSFLTDGTDGELVLTLDDTVTTAITEFKGYMDIKRTSGGEPYLVNNEPIEVFFKEVVTA